VLLLCFYDVYSSLCRVQDEKVAHQEANKKRAEEAAKRKRDEEQQQQHVGNGQPVVAVSDLQPFCFLFC
jgi:hypothetical protein